MYLWIALSQVVAMAVNSGLVTFPVSYSVAYKTSGLTIWAPQPPPGYAAMGCVANPGDDPPALTEVVCIAIGIGEHLVCMTAPWTCSVTLHCVPKGRQSSILLVFRVFPCRC